MGTDNIGRAIWGQTICGLMFFVADGVVRMKGLIDDGMEKHPSCYAVVLMLLAHYLLKIKGMLTNNE